MTFAAQWVRDDLNAPRGAEGDVHGIRAGAIR